MKKNTVFSIRSLCKYFNDTPVLHCINLDIYQNESIVILGSSGTGKSVFIKILLQLLKPDCGEIYFKGKLTSKMSNYELKKFYKSIGMLFQESALFDSLPVWKNVMFGPLMNTKISTENAKMKACELLESVGLSQNDLLKEISELSGGMKKRVALARAIASSPEVLFFDEPTTGLDPIMSDNIINLISKHSKNLKATTITITHDLLVAKKIASRIIMLHHGKFVFNGTYEELLQSKNTAVIEFLKPWRTAQILKR